MNRIFISYSHEDEEWKDRLVTQLKVLEMEGYCTLWDDRKIKIGENWFSEIEMALKEAQIIIMIISAHFLTSRFIRNEEIPRIFERKETEGILVIPVIVKPCAWKSVKWLASMQVMPTDGKPLIGGNEYEIESELTILVEKIGSLLKGEKASASISAATGGPRLYLAELPTTSGTIFGREKELETLDRAWADNRTNIVCITAWGGTGKSALVNEWINQLQKENYMGAQKVFGWSFEDQSTGPERRSSADLFLAKALAWFGEPGYIADSPWDKGLRLAELIREQKNLLILDGLETLQNPTGGMQGLLNSSGLEVLLKALGRSNPGLCIISSRLPIKDLEHITSPAVERIHLKQLSRQSGERLLKSLGVKGASTDLNATVDEFNGHALALTLLGRYLAVVYNGDVRKRDLIPRLVGGIDEENHTRRIMESYESWLADKPELNILYMTGFFNRPVEDEIFQILRTPPPIKGLTGTLKDFDRAKWQFGLQFLRNLRLLAKKDPNQPNRIDCHPLVREYFGETFRKNFPDSWKEGHNRLYQHYKSLSKPGEVPLTIKEMKVLYLAMIHACQAGRYREALDFYKKRILLGEKNFSWKQFGLLDQDLSALSYLFISPWSETVCQLSRNEKAFVMRQVGFHLMHLTRLAGALEPLKNARTLYTSTHDWKNAAVTCCDLSKLRLLTGEIEEARRFAEEAREFAQKSDNRYVLVGAMCASADAHFHAGDTDSALEIFREAERIHSQMERRFPYLFGYRGYRYHEVMLANGCYEEVMKRAAEILEWGLNGNKSTFSIGLTYLSLGRAKFFLMRDGMDVGTVKEDLEKALSYLRSAMQIQHIVRALLALSAFYRSRGEPEKAKRCLVEGREIADKDPCARMKLHYIDCSIELALLYLDKNDSNTAFNEVERVQELIRETGYFRREPELKELLIHFNT